LYSSYFFNAYNTRKAYDGLILNGCDDCEVYHSHDKFLDNVLYCSNIKTYIKTMIRRHKKRSQISDKKIREIIKSFCLYLTAINKYFDRFRTIMLTTEHPCQR
jgi:hypothetical protein